MMDEKVFQAMLDLFMCVFPYTPGQIHRKVVEDFLNKESRARGFSDWVEAYQTMPKEES